MNSVLSNRGFLMVEPIEQNQAQKEGDISKNTHPETTPLNTS